jgi:hypothetical protein
MTLRELATDSVVAVLRGAQIGLTLGGDSRPGGAGSDEQLTRKVAQAEAELRRRGLGGLVDEDGGEAMDRRPRRCSATVDRGWGPRPCRMPAYMDGLCMGCHRAREERNFGAARAQIARRPLPPDSDTRRATMSKLSCETCGKLFAKPGWLAAHKAAKHGGATGPPAAWPKPDAEPDAAMKLARFARTVIEALGYTGVMEWPDGADQLLAIPALGKAARIAPDGTVTSCWLRAEPQT